MKKHLLLLFYICLAAFKVDAQQNDTLVVLLTKSEVKKNDSKLISPVRLLSDEATKDRFKGLPPEFNIFRFFVVDMQVKQSIYQRFMMDEMDSSTFNNAVKNFKIDKKKLTKNFINQETNIFVGIRGNQKIIICDLNKNDDFSDDSIQRFEIKKVFRSTPLDSIRPVEVAYDYFYQNKIHKRKSLIKIRPFDASYNIKDTLQKVMSIYVSMAEIMTNKVNIFNKIYTVKLPYTFYKGGDYSTAFITFSDSSDTHYLDINPLPKIGDSFVLEENTRVKILSISEFGDTLKLKVWKPSDSEMEIGFRTGDQTLLTSFETIRKKLFEPKSYRDKYLLLDFWGTWCGPCVAGLPKLKEFYQKYKNQIELVSIAHDKDIEKVKKFIEEKEMNWVHKFEKSGEKNPEKLVEKLNVECFPTFILLDKSGKILSRGCGEQQLKEIEKILH
jgi:thiol-disulfide isomerase/thioredoxin